VSTKTDGGGRFTLCGNGSANDMADFVTLCGASSTGRKSAVADITTLW
jgi:hypothetical protein